jgi:hypothetical protein
VLLVFVLRSPPSYLVTVLLNVCSVLCVYVCMYVCMCGRTHIFVYISCHYVILYIPLTFRSVRFFRKNELFDRKKLTAMFHKEQEANHKVTVKAVHSESGQHLTV